MSLYDIAQSVVSKTNEITEGKEKISTIDIVKFFPLGIHINNFDFITNKKGEALVVFTFTEDPTKFFFGGQMLHQIAEKWCNAMNGASDVIEELQNHPVHVRLIPTKTKNNRDFTKVEILKD